MTLLLILAATIALIVIIGWHTNNTSLQRLWLGDIAMVYQTARMMVLSSLMIECIRRGWPIFVSILAAILLWSVSYSAHLPSGVHPPSVGTLLCFNFLAISSMLSVMGHRKLSMLSGTGTLVTSAVALAGHVAGIPQLYWNNFGPVSMAVPTTICFVLLSIVLLRTLLKKTS